MMDYETEINKINNIKNAIEMLDKKKAYYQLEKLNDLNFDIMFIKKIQWSQPKNSDFLCLLQNFYGNFMPYFMKMSQKMLEKQKQ